MKQHIAPHKLWSQTLVKLVFLGPTLISIKKKNTASLHNHEKHVNKFVTLLSSVFSSEQMDYG